jgi:hypothetical protein
MYCLWKTGGTTVRPWRQDVVYGSVPYEDGLLLSVEAKEEWNGKLLFDIPRHRENMHLPVDWPRINQFPEWFTVQPGKTYAVSDLSKGTEVHLGCKVLQEGLPLELKPGEKVRLYIRPL